VRIVVLLKQVPDLVEELELDDDGTDIEREFLKFLVNEFDDYALEEAILIKEATGAEVVVVALDDPDVDGTLYAALARGADRAVKLTGSGAAEAWIDSHRRATLLAAWLKEAAADLVLTGVQAADDLDGQLASLLGAHLGRPHVAVVVAVEPAEDGKVRVRQEFSGGTSADLDVELPAVIGVQAARQAPRYVPITRIRQAMAEGGIDEVEAPDAGQGGGLTVTRLYPPESTGHAEMLTGSPEDVADRLLEIIRAKGVLG
jgi:electron transfer flavoprotein beta subunit